jgi:hypothetical protein
MNLCRHLNYLHFAGTLGYHARSLRALGSRESFHLFSILTSPAWIIDECRREAADAEARRGFSQVRATQAYLQSVEETDREKPRRVRASAAAAGVHE